MTEIIVGPGICSFVATIEVVALSGCTVRVTVASDCEKVVEAKLGFACLRMLALKFKRNPEMGNILDKLER